jgi:hypothetical protein
MYKGFISAQKIGINILPNHFYSQIPNISSLNREKNWRLPMSMYGINGIDTIQQLEFVKSVCLPEYVKNLQTKNVHELAVKENGEDGGYGIIEANFLYCFICNKKPSKIIQIGCGVSTSVIIMAAKYTDYKPEIICVEPYPTEYLIESSKKNDITLLKEKAQDVDPEILYNLNENDLLFIDSTHTVKPGSEVNKIILEILPRLKKSIWVHFHDIYFPYDYKRDILNGDLFFWLESTLLHAFLINNVNFKIMVSQSMLHYSLPSELKKILPNYEPQSNEYGLRSKNYKGIHFPSAIYLQTI